MNVTVIAVIAALMALYLLSCLVWPWTACGRCEGGKLRSPRRGAFRECPRCGGRGRRLRFGAWILGRRRR